MSDGTSEQKGLIIHRLQASNVLRLSVVDITPDKDGIIIGGANEAGKSSVLNSVAMVLGGGKQVPEKVLREGQAKGEVKVDLGDFTVTRTWKKNDNGRLKIQPKKGKTAPTTQTMLSDLYNAVTFDPFGWSRKDGASQREDLLKVAKLELDLDLNLSDRKKAFDERTLVGRERDKIKGALALTPEVEAPKEEIEVRALVEEYQNAILSNTERQKRKDAVERAEVKAKNLLEAAKLAKLDAQRAGEAVSTAYSQLNAHADLIDTAEVSVRIDEAKAQNVLFETAKERRATEKKLEEKDGEYEHLSSAIQTLDDARIHALAGAQLPLEGLGFDETGVTYEGIPFGQLAQSVRLRVSCAMAMELNRPENGGANLRVFLCRDGALLDDKNLQLLLDIAREGGYQAWIETVGEDEKCSIIMEDGRVKTSG